MEKRNVTLLVGVACLALAAGVRLLLPYPASLYFVFPFGVGVSALLGMLPRSIVLSVLVAAPLMLIGFLLSSVGLYDVDGAPTLIMSPVMGMGFLVGAIGWALLLHGILGPCRPMMK